MKDPFDSPAFKTIRNLEKTSIMRTVRKINEMPAMKIMRHVEICNSLHAIQKLQNSPIMQAINDLNQRGVFSAISKIERLSHVQGFSHLHKFSELTFLHKLESINNIASISKKVDGLYQLQGLAEACDFIEYEYDENLSFDNINEVTEDMVRRIDESPQGRLSTEFYLSLMFALFSLYFSMVSNEETEDRLLTEMKRLEITISEKMEKLEETKENVDFLIADTPVNLRYGSSTTYDILSVIPENKKVIEIDRYRDWVRIEYFDHIKNINLSGWAHSKYFLEFPNKNEDDFMGE